MSHTKTKVKTLITSLFIILFISCKENNETKIVPQVIEEETEKVNSDSRVTKIEQVESREEDNKEENNNIAKKNDLRISELELIHSYKKNKYKDITDENGFVQEYTIEELKGETVDLGNSEKIKYTREDKSYEGGVIWDSYQLNVSLREKKYVLKINGEIQHKISTVQQVYSVLHKFKFRDLKKIEYIFEPEMEKIDKRKSVFQSVNDLYSYGKRLPRDEDTETKWKKAYQNIIKSSGVLDIKTYNDYVEYKKGDQKEETVITNTSEVNEEVKSTSTSYFKISVDNLRVRTSPELNSEKIENLGINTEVEFLEKSTNQTSVTIENQEITEYWYKVKTPTGNIGWIHGCCFNK